MSDPTDNTAAGAAGQTQTNENAEEKSLAFSSMENPNEEEKADVESDKNKGAEGSSEKEVSSDKDKQSEPETEEEVDYSQIKCPDGFELDKDIMAQVSPVLKELKCSKENAEKIVAAGAEVFNKAIQAQADAYAQKVSDWEKETRADEILGKEENIAIANRAVLEFGDERLTKEIIEAGLGNHPAFVRFCYKVGKAICEDQVVNSTGSATASNRNELGEPVLQFKSMD